MENYLNHVKILIVDDSYFILSLLRQMLGVLDAKKIYDAGNGEEAWEKVIADTPDLINVDWEMKPMNGIEFTHRIRNGDNSPNPYIPVIMMTGHSDRERVTIARDAGVTEFVTKPIAAKALFERIVSVVERPRDFVRTKIFYGPNRRRRHTEDVDDERRASKIKGNANAKKDINSG